MIGTQPQREASEEKRVEADAYTEQLCLPGNGLTLTEMFRVLDVLRRRLARNTRGQEGAFAGFDVLDVSGWHYDAESTPILFSARRVADDRKSQVVKYVASRCAHHDGLCHGTATGDPVVQAGGTTVGLGQSAPVTSDPRRLSIASPHR